MIHRSDALGLAFGGATLTSAVLFGPGVFSLGVPVAVFVALLTDGIVRPGSGILYPTVTHGPRDGKRVSLTFDDGPDPESTPRILDALAAAGMRASFFVIGSKLDAHPAIARRIVAEGHELGNHTYQHSRMNNLFGARRQAEQITQGREAIRRYAPDTRQPLYRSPIGLKNPSLASVAAREGLIVVAWSLHSRDTRVTEPDQLANRVLSRVRPGDIILMHDGHDLPGRHRTASAAALPLILEGLARRNMRSVTVSELIGTGREQVVERKLA